MEEDVRPKGERRKLPAMVVAQSAWREVKLNNGGGSLGEVEGERKGGKRTSTTIHPQGTKRVNDKPG